MKTLKVKYFDIEKYESDWRQYYKDEETIHSNRLMSPNDKGFGPYLKNVEIRTEKFMKYDISDQYSVFDYFVEIDNDYLYHDIATDGYYSHINTLRLTNEYYNKYKDLHLANLTDDLFGQIERDLKLKTIIQD